MSGKFQGIPGGGGYRVPKINPRAILGVVVVVLALAFALDSVFTVEPEEVALVLRFGEYNRTVEPGINMKLPVIESKIRVPVQRQLKQEFGYRTVTAAVRTQYSDQQFLDESLMLTGDLNVAVVDWITQYRVTDPYLYTFKLRNITDTFRDMNEAVIRAVVGDRSVTEVLTVGRQEIASEVERRLQEMCDQYETGVRVEQVVLQDVNPPDDVKPSFNEVNQAQQERERMINEARSQYNRLVPKARGEAQQMIQEAEGYATDRVNRAQGDAVAFEALLAAYKRSPEVTRRRIYLETLQEIYPKMQRKVVLDDGLEGILPLLNLSGEGK